MALAIVFSGCLAFPGAASSSGTSQPFGAPTGLAAYGHELWELDALLHDTFGKRLVYLRAGDGCFAANFTLAFTAVASGGPYAFTFADASHSTFKLTRTARPPKPVDCDSDANTPLTIAGAYISCGRGRWLYEDEGPGSPNEWVACLPSPDNAPSTFAVPKAWAPPSGLTPYGHDTWELDALLHDTFGKHRVNLRWGNPYYNTLNSFTTNRVPAKSGGLFVYTFANASHSTFRLVRPSRPPQFFHGNTESWEPFTISGAYISCARRLWLYEPEGEPNENQFVTCVASTSPPPPTPTTTGAKPLLLTMAASKRLAANRPEYGFPRTPL